MNYPETQIQKAIVQYLKVMKIFCFHIPNERKTSAQAMGRLISIGLRPGAADLELWIPLPGVDRHELYECMKLKKKYGGPLPDSSIRIRDDHWMLAMPVYVEVKDTKGRQSDNQRKFERRCDVVGFEYWIVRSVEDVQELLGEYGIG